MTPWRSAGDSQHERAGPATGLRIALSASLAALLASGCTTVPPPQPAAEFRPETAEETALAVIPASDAPTANESPGTAPPDQPPTLTVNGVAGDPLSWCYGTGCADGVYLGPSSGLPGVSDPRLIVVGVPATIGDVRVIGTDGAEASVGFDEFVLDPLPAGQWERLQITVTFIGGGDATYLWRLGD